MDIVNLFKMFEVSADDCILKYITQDIKDFPNKKIQKMLANFYKSTDPIAVRMGSLINSLFTHQASTFMYTRRSLIELLKEDSNHSHKSIDYKQFNILRSTMLNNGIFTCLREPTNNKSGVFKLINKELLDILVEQIGKDFLEAKEKRVLEYYDNGKKETNKRLIEMWDNPDFVAQVKKEKELINQSKRDNYE